MAALPAAMSNAQAKFAIPADYLREAPDIPGFWLSTVGDVRSFLNSKVSKGKVRTIGRSAGGREIHSVFYGTPRSGKGTTTFSGSLGYRDVRAYLGPDWNRKVYCCIAGVHGGEFEGIVGTVNLISVLETGRDLRGKEWPEIQAAAAKLDRIVLVPIVNPDGRERVPLRMIASRGDDYTVQEYLNTGGKPDGSLIGWPGCKKYIPLDFSTTQFPGGYPNDAGVNIMHDDFMGNPQPETRALYTLTSEERPDLILNMHTGARFFKLLRPNCETPLTPVFDAYYRRLLTKLTEAGLQSNEDVEANSDPSKLQPFPNNLDAILNLHCGALCLTPESPSHSSPVAKRQGAEPLIHTPNLLLDLQLIAHQEAMGFLAETGGRIAWTTKA